MNPSTRVSSRGRVSKVTLRHVEADEWSGTDSDSDSSYSGDCYEAVKSRKGKSRGGYENGSGKTRVLHRWTPEQHQLLERLVAQYGTEKRWAEIATYIPGRSGKQCRERWLNHLQEGLIKGRWTVEEEFLLGLCHALLGSHWSQMVRRLPGRCENSIKNFWNATLRSKPASKKRGLLWAYMQNRDLSRPELNRAAFVLAVEQMRGSDYLPPFIRAAHVAGRLKATSEWESMFEAEAAYLSGMCDTLPTTCLPSVVHEQQQQRPSASSSASPSSSEGLGDQGGRRAGAAQQQGLVAVGGYSSLDPPAVITPAKRGRPTSGSEDQAGSAAASAATSKGKRQGQVRLAVQKLVTPSPQRQGQDRDVQRQQQWGGAADRAAGKPHKAGGGAEERSHARSRDTAAAAPAVTHVTLCSPRLFTGNASASKPVHFGGSSTCAGRLPPLPPLQHAGQQQAAQGRSSNGFSSAAPGLLLRPCSSLGINNYSTEGCEDAAAAPCGAGGEAVGGSYPGLASLTPSCQLAAAAAHTANLDDLLPVPPLLLAGNASSALGLRASSTSASSSTLPAAVGTAEGDGAVAVQQVMEGYPGVGAEGSGVAGPAPKKRRVSVGQLGANLDSSLGLINYDCQELFGWLSPRGFDPAALQPQPAAPAVPAGVLPSATTAAAAHQAPAGMRLPLPSSLSLQHQQQHQAQQHQAQHVLGGYHGLLGLQLGRQESCDLLDGVEGLMSPGWEHRLMSAPH